jgi:hypothetical protein
MSFAWLAGRKLARLLPALLLAGAAVCATRPHYGGTLRVEIHEAIETPDPPQSGIGLPDLSAAFTIMRWEAGSRAVFTADDSAPGGRPYIDGVEVRMGRPLRDQSISLDLNRADIVELGPAELRRQMPAEHKIWTSSPVRVIALVFSPRVEDPRLREALSLAVDRATIHRVLLQRLGDVSGALLPQWLSGYAFVFSAAQDLAKARVLAGGPRSVALSVDDPALRPIADRIAINARDAGLTITVGQNPNADVRLAEAYVNSNDPSRALTGLAAAFGLPAPQPSPEGLYGSERALLEGYRVVPLFHLPVVYGVGPRVKGGPGITPLGEWRFENLWIEGARP